MSENEYCNTKRIVEEFISENGPGPFLQSKLLERYHNTDNWVKNKGFLRLYVKINLIILMIFYLFTDE